MFRYKINDIVCALDTRGRPTGFVESGEERKWADYGLMRRRVRNVIEFIDANRSA